MDVPRARRVARPAWINLRTVAGLALFAGSIVAAGRFLEAAHTTSPAWAAARDLPAGAPLMPADVRAVEVNLPDDLAVAYLGGRSLPSGLVTIEAVPEGQLIPSDAVGDADDVGAGRALTVPVPPEHAVGGALRPGDLVDVFATTGAGGALACTRLVAAGVEVLDVVESGGVVVESGAPAGVTLSVSPEQAAALAHAVRTADIDVARHDGVAATAAPVEICGGGAEEASP